MLGHPVSRRPPTRCLPVLALPLPPPSTARDARHIHVLRGRPPGRQRQFGPSQTDYGNLAQGSKGTAAHQA
eukprot:2793639-Heterocapsa_arctica.AAC.1